MSEQQGKQSQHPQPQAKKQQEASDLFKCNLCMKNFNLQSAFIIHMKQKHPQENKQKVFKPITRNKVLQQQQNDLQDNVYAFLGQLGQKHQENNDKKPEIILPDQSNKVTGQTNYSINLVVRTPYEPQLQAKNQIPEKQIQASSYKDFLIILKNQILALEQKIQQERQQWEFRDPMAPEQEAQNQFSLMDIRKLIRNYPRRQIKLLYPHFCVFMLWISRVCKSPAWKQFFIAIGQYLAMFTEYQKEKGQNKSNWQTFWKIYSKNKVTTSLARFKISDAKDGQKLLQYFTKWTQLFELVPE